MPYDGSQAMSHIGFKLAVGDGNSEETFEFIAELTDAPKIKLVTKEADTTNFDSTDGVEENMPTTIDPGSMTFSAHWIKSTYEALRTLQRSRSVVGWKLTHPDVAGTIEYVRGWVKSVEENLSLREASTIQCEVRLTGVLEIDPA